MQITIQLIRHLWCSLTHAGEGDGEGQTEVVLIYLM
jgi:hypothetical protein